MMRICLALLVLLLAGCTTFDPYQRTDVWLPTGSNAGNIAATAVNPRDLIIGRGESWEDAHQAAGAVDRVWQDRAKPLLKTGDSASGGGAAASGGQN
jgi:type IV pilus biogenesis protein CpaD/CtpE